MQLASPNPSECNALRSPSVLHGVDKDSELALTALDYEPAFYLSFLVSEGLPALAAFPSSRVAVIM